MVLSTVISVLDSLLADSSEFPPSSFHFKVVLSSAKDDTSFQEVSGIEAEVQIEEYVEGGENRFVHKLPKPLKHSNLVLKRGIAKLDSELVTWCRSVLESDFASPISPAEVSVHLLNEEGDPLRSWSFAGAYPVKWQMDTFNSTKNEVAIETIELAYSYSTRVI